MKTKSQYTQFRFEDERDMFDYFIVEKYETVGYYSHLHRNAELYCVYEGSVRVHIDNKEYLLEAGDAAFVNSLQMHSYECSEKSVVAFALLGTRYMQPFTDLFPDRLLPSFLNDKEKNKPLFDILSSLYGRRYNPAPRFTSLESFGYINLILHYIVSGYGTVPKPKYAKGHGGLTISSIIQYICDNTDSDLSLVSIAEKFNYAPLTLSKLFSQYVKIDLRNFINSIRIQKVLELKKLPAYKDKSILELSSLCGFNSPSSFYRAYKRFQMLYATVPQ